MDKVRKDLTLLGGLLITAFLFWLIPFLLNIINKDLPATVIVYQDGQKLADYALSEDQTVVIPWKEEGFNLLLIENGRARVTDADCPDQLCVRQRSIGRKGESIICLPHRLVVEINAKEERELDALTY